MEDYEYVDIEPMVISINCKENNTWIHPDIDNYFKPNTYDNTIDDKVFKMHIQTEDDKTLTIVFKSEELNNRIEADIYSVENWNFENIYSMMCTVLLEDVWMPGGEQFVFTNFGKKVSEIISFDKPVNASLTPDVGLEGDSEGYSWCT